MAENKRGAFYNTLEEFHKYWDRVEIICQGRSDHRLPTIDDRLFENVFIHPSPWPLLMQPLWILKKGKKLYREHKFDVITVHEYPPFYNGIGARLLWQKIRVPYVLEIHHIPGYPLAADLKERIYGFAMRCFIKYDAAKAKAVRVVNQRQVPEFLIKAGVPADKIKYMPSAYIDLEVFRPMPETDKKYDLVFAARLERNKGVNVLLAAARILISQRPGVKLLIIGDGPLKPGIQKYIREYKLENNVFLSGWLPALSDVAIAYNSAKIFVNPSFNEGGPRVVLEAMACGLPIITTKVGITLDVVKDGGNGLFTDWAPQQMADKILYLLNDRELQKKFSEAGLEIVNQFEKKSAIQNYAEKLQNLVGK